MPKPSRHRYEIKLPEGVDPQRVSLACATGEHAECLGRVAVRRPDGKPGRIYIPCECPKRCHPKPSVPQEPPAE